MCPCGKPLHYMDLRLRRAVERLIEATKGNRWAQRDATMILLAYRHGLRASEL